MAVQLTGILDEMGFEFSLVKTALLVVDHF